MTNIKEVYSKGVITVTSAFFADWDKKKCPSEPIIPIRVKGINSYKFGMIKFFGKKNNDVKNKAKE